MGKLYPKGTGFRWQSNTFYTTADGLMNGSAAITEDLYNRGLAVGGAGSGGGSIFPGAAEYGANITLLQPMGDDEARQLIEDAFANTFTFLSAVTASWDAITSGTREVVGGTVADIKADALAAKSAALPLTSLVVVGILGVAVIVVAMKFK